MAGEGVQQLDVALGVVHALPVEVLDVNDLEEPARLDLVLALLELAGPQPRSAGRNPLTDLVVDVLDLAEERVPAVWQHVLGVPEGEVTARRQRFPCPRVTDRRVDPVPGGGGEHEGEPLADGRPPVLEPSLDDLDVEAGGVPASGCREERPALDTGIRNPRRASGRVALPVAQPTSSRRLPGTSPAIATTSSRSATG
jgi:hypothetical protein